METKHIEPASHDHKESGLCNIPCQRHKAAIKTVATVKHDDNRKWSSAFRTQDCRQEFLSITAFEAYPFRILIVAEWRLGSNDIARFRPAQRRTSEETDRTKTQHGTAKLRHWLLQSLTSQTYHRSSSEWNTLHIPRGLPGPLAPDFRAYDPARRR